MSFVNFGGTYLKFWRWGDLKFWGDLKIMGGPRTLAETMKVMGKKRSWNSNMSVQTDYHANILKNSPTSHPNVKIRNNRN